nr:uncharacterized protein LOC109744661 [Aegilops tauschii subsp. strangulata]
MLDDVFAAEPTPPSHSANGLEETAKAFLDILASSRKPLYEGAKLSMLDAMSQLMAVKAEYGCSRGFEAFLGVWANSLPEGHELPKTMYAMKKIMKTLSMDYEKMHGQKQQLKIPVKVFRYLDFIKRLGKRYNPNKIVHPSEGEAWKSFEIEYPEEATEAGNARIAISGDGFNPYGMSSNPYSRWPVFVIPLNLPPSAIMQCKTMFLSLIIPGPEYSGKNLSVFMQPLVDDLHHSWYFPRLTYDRHLQKNFLMKVWLQYYMHDFPGYALFCGWCTSGKMPCPVCVRALRFIWLKKGGKYVAFDLHRQFLPRDHPDGDGKKNFTKGLVVHEVNEIPTFSGADVLAQLKARKPAGEGKGKGKGKATGEDEGEGEGKGKGKGEKCFEGYGETHNWTHITPFTQLPYFKDVKLPYNIDVMHT